MLALIAEVAFASVVSAGCNFDLAEQAGWAMSEPITENGARQDTYIDIDFNFIWRADQPARMIDGYVEVEDVLGATIGNFELDRDVQLVPGEAFSKTLPGVRVGDERRQRNSFARLMRVHPDDVVLNVCIRGVVYEDGTVARF